MQFYKGKISIIMPAYNEGRHILSNIRETERTFNDLGVKYEIIVVDDGSNDNTLAEAKRAATAKGNLIVIKNTKNHGKGYSLKNGFRRATGELVLFLDADLELHPGQIRTLYDIMELQEVDVVIGSKRHPDSRLDYPLQRRIVSSVYFFLIKLLFGLPLRDTQTGIKLFKKEVLKKAFPRMLVKRYAYDLELLVIAHHFGYKIGEAPVVLNFKEKMGSLNFGAVYLTWWDTMAIFYRMYILKYYDEKK
ncbi:MAG: glycosyltransferase [Candidatus Firestonebacteria bacterium]|nr:glycosyltransferase [Candidatus Firestonebacteria bacterium]